MNNQINNPKIDEMAIEPRIPAATLFATSEVDISLLSLFFWQRFQLVVSTDENKVNLHEKMDRYKLLKRLHSGSNSRVYLAQISNTNEKVIIKVANHGSHETHSTTRMKESECHNLASKHPNVVKLYDTYEMPKPVPNEFSKLTGPILVMEYCVGGDMYQYLNKFGMLSEHQARKYYYQLLEALSYIHRHNIVHRDVKLENLLISHMNDLKLADWGLSTTFHSEQVMNDSCGSPHYAPPEVWTKSFYVGPELDVWSSGICLYAMLSASLPYRDKNMDKLKNKIIAGKLPFHKSIRGEAWNLLLKVLHPNLKLRFTIEDALSHAWMHPESPLWTHSEYELKEASAVRFQISDSGLDIAKLAKNDTTYRSQQIQILRLPEKVKKWFQHNNLK